MTPPASPAPVASTLPTTTSGTQDALSLLASDTSLASELSPVGRAMAGALDSGLGIALGLGKDLSAAGVDAVADLAGSLTGDLASVFGASLGTIVSGVASAVPVIGAIIGLLSSVFGADLTAEEQQACESLWQIFAPRASGSTFGGGSGVLPADLFVAEHATCLSPSGVLDGTHNLMPFGPQLYRSVQGMAWMQLLIGSIVYADDLNWKNIRAKVLPTLSKADQEKLKDEAAMRRAFDASVERDAEIAPRQYAVMNPHKPRVGLPPAWRKRFRTLLRAIEELHRSPFHTATVPLDSDGNPASCVSVTPRLHRGRTGPSDGGAALWMIVADLVAAAFHHGYLTWDYALFLLTRQLGSFGGVYYNANAVWRSVGDPPSFYSDNAVPWMAAWLLGTVSDDDLLQINTNPFSLSTASPSTSLWGTDTCPSLIVNQLKQQVTQWKLSTHPLYEQGEHAAAELEKSARDAARRAAAPPATAGGAHESSHSAASTDDDDARLLGVGVGLGLVVGLIAWLGRTRSHPLGPARRPTRWP